MLKCSAFVQFAKDLLAAPAMLLTLGYSTELESVSASERSRAGSNAK